MTEQPSQLVLVGLPGVGKSTVGAAVAERLGWGFVDLDAEIERRAGLGIPELFELQGEGAFRDYERAVTEELVGRPRLVVAPGGGWIAQPGLAALLRPSARIIYLAAPAAVVARRVAAGRAARPLLAGGDLAAALARLLAEREAHYRTADVVLDTEILDEQEVIRRVAVLAPTSPGG